jgi:isoleucyl-tRNA synthetase
VKPNFKAIGPKHGKLAPKIAAALKQLADPAAARKQLLGDGRLALTVDGQPVELSADEVEIRLQARPGWSAAPGKVGVVVLSTEISDALREEGLVRELIHHVQTLRKERNLAYEARITLYVEAPAALAALLRRHEPLVRSECLAERIEHGLRAGLQATEAAIEEYAARLAIETN